MTYIFGGILESYQAREMAEDHNRNFPQYIPQTEEQAAKEFFDAIIIEEDGHFGDMPAYHRFVGSIDDEWDLYYDYGADYYFAVNDNMEE